MKTQHTKTWEAIKAVIRRNFVEIKIPKKKKNLKEPDFTSKKPEKKEQTKPKFAEERV